MPIYEYKCKNCGERFEVFVFSPTKDNIVCGECGSENTERLISTFASSGSSTFSESSCGSGGFS